jgi:hypothetical protein
MPQRKKKTKKRNSLQVKKKNNDILIKNLDKRNTQVGICLAKIPSLLNIEKAIKEMDIDIITKKHLTNLNRGKIIKKSLFILFRILD